MQHLSDRMITPKYVLRVGLIISLSVMRPKLMAMDIAV